MKPHAPTIHRRFSGCVPVALLRVGGLLLATVVVVSASDTAAPDITLSLRGVARQTIEQGEPLRIAVVLEAPLAAANPIELAPSTGTWADAITVELAGAKTGDVVLRGQAVGRPDTPHATLTREQIAGGLWRISAEATRSIAPGDYVVRARLKIAAGAGWTGEVVSEDVDLHIVPVSNDPARVTQRVLGLAADALTAGDVERAARLIDVELARDPDDVALLSLRAEVAYRAGNTLAALACVNRASRLAAAGAREPSFELAELRNHVTALLLAPTGADATPAPPPDWTWPPRAVLVSPAQAIAGERGPAPVDLVATAADSQPTPAVAPAAMSPAPASPVVPSPEPRVVALPSMGVVIPATELNDARAIADPAGQWAVSAKASSQYGNSQYSATQATGAPNIAVAGDSPDAWCPANKNNGSDCLEATFAQPVHATGLRVRQNNAPGAITKIEAIEPDGTVHVWWEGVDPYPTTEVREIVWFAVRVPQTDYLVAKVKITLNLATIPGWNQIDAVQLVGTAK